MSTGGSYPEKLPLSVLLFHAAMGRDQSISDFAEALGVGPISLRQFILGKTQRPRQKTIDLIGQTLGISSDDVRRRMDLLPEAAPKFNEWLESQIEGRFSRAKLTRETKISDGALRNYLSGQTLPDADQANRLVMALQVDSLQIASMIVANQVAESGGSFAQPEAPAESEAPPAGAMALATDSVTMAPIPADAPAASVATSPHTAGNDEDHLLSLWRRLHPQGRRATVQYIATLLAEG
ncbi:XRE family transcriptional regulator [Oscillochloris sp. ZM17-4]|uniref:XRE family transcriptional regulator n=1 Tax=Oscillochloris sp. ZM17-4 TaxID=2866714 RepID=UPI001C73B388|nr:XRE family transcriptional regulator [Oscillochloris sp. ZM17-4]MBX0327656.1 XRE family transcriptional regulator [Oscillochloris sp. ZM17-4]